MLFAADLAVVFGRHLEQLQAAIPGQEADFVQRRRTR